MEAIHKSTFFSVPCSNCGFSVQQRNPFPTVDVVLYRHGQGIVLIERVNAPYGWALPGGFIDYGESAEQAAVREAGRRRGWMCACSDFSEYTPIPGGSALPYAKRGICGAVR
jgi:ADP-ribose pyrophosphatase